jgi:predicted SnoaL-like aldol condensation-catalyzing enzyme
MASDETTAASERSKQLVIRFYNALAQRDLATIRALGRADYIQHNPAVATGLEAVIEWFQRLPAPASKPAPLQFVRVIAEGDYVVTIRRIPDVGTDSKPADPERERAIVDVWRVQDGQVAEHADFYEQFPRGSEPPKNSNGRFF